MNWTCAAGLYLTDVRVMAPPPGTLSAEPPSPAAAGASPLARNGIILSPNERAVNRARPVLSRAGRMFDLHGGQLRRALAVRRVVPALEARRALLGEGAARLHEVVFGAVIAQAAGQAIQIVGNARP